MTLSPSAVAREAGTSQPPRRLLGRRLSASHLLIGIVVILAFALNLLALSDRSASTLVGIADRELAAGTVLDAEDIRWVPVANSFEGLEALVGEAEAGALAGRVLTHDIADGAPLLRSGLAEAAAPKGLLAMSIPIGEEHAAGGTISGGDRVDVIAVLDGAADYLLSDVLVLTAGERGASIGDLGEGHLVLAVSDTEALALATAMHTASLEVVKATGARRSDG